MKKFKLYKPLDYMLVTQEFGLNYANFYQEMGMKGHNGIDFRCHYNKVYAAHDGVIKYGGKYKDGGIGIELISDYTNPDGSKFKTIYYHLDSIGKDVKPKEHFLRGQLMAISDNTGKYTTAHHLHFGLKMVDKFWNTLNWTNGYHGAIDPTPYLVKDFYNLPVDNRYGQARSVLREIINRNKYPFLRKEQNNAMVYGGYPYSEVINDSFKPIWVFLRREEYIAGVRPPFKLIM